MTVSAIEDFTNVVPVVYKWITSGAQSPNIVRTSPTSTATGTGIWYFNWTPSDDGIYSVTVDQFNVSGVQIGSSTASVTISPRPVAIPTP